MPFGSRRPLLPATCLQAHQPNHSDVHWHEAQTSHILGRLPPPRHPSNLNMASSWKDIASSAMYAGTPQSLQLLVIRGIVGTETAYLSNIRALPTPADSADTFGLKGNLQHPPAILVHHIEADATTYVLTSRTSRPSSTRASTRWRRRLSWASRAPSCRSSAGQTWSVRVGSTPRS